MVERPVMRSGGRRILWWLVLPALLTACDRSPHPEYKQIDRDIYLRLHMLGEGERIPLDGDSILMRLRISKADSITGSFFSTEQWYAVNDLRNSAFKELLIRMHEGDSMSMITPSGSMPWSVLLEEEDRPSVNRHEELRTEVSLLAIRTAAMIQEEEERLRALDPLDYEQQLAKGFIEDLGEGWQQWGTSDVYYFIQGIAVDTNQVRAGDVVTISYTGKRLEDDSTFDSTENNGGPMTFRFGDKAQVINGLEVAVTLLREGQEGDFLLPSEYAFGSRGVEGMIEPYTPVLYRVRLEDVQRRKRTR